MQMMFICLSIRKQAYVRASTCPSCKEFAVQAPHSFKEQKRIPHPHLMFFSNKSKSWTQHRRCSSLIKECTANSFVRTFMNQCISFVLMFLCLQKWTSTKKAPCPRNVIPGQDQGSYLNAVTNAHESIVQVQRSDSWSLPGMTT